MSAHLSIKTRLIALLKQNTHKTPDLKTLRVQRTGWKRRTQRGIYTDCECSIMARDNDGIYQEYTRDISGKEKRRESPVPRAPPVKPRCVMKPALFIDYHIIREMRPRQSHFKFESQPLNLASRHFVGGFLASHHFVAGLQSILKLKFARPPVAMSSVLLNPLLEAERPRHRILSRTIVLKSPDSWKENNATLIDMPILKRNGKMESTLNVSLPSKWKRIVRQWKTYRVSERFSGIFCFFTSVLLSQFDRLVLTGCNGRAASTVVTFGKIVLWDAQVEQVAWDIEWNRWPSRRWFCAR